MSIIEFAPDFSAPLSIPKGQCMSATIEQPEKNRITFSSRFKKVYVVGSTQVRRHPLISFFAALLLLLLLIIASNFLAEPKSQTTSTKPVPKQVSVYHIGSAPTISLPAKINKTGVIAIMAQTAGIIQSVNVTEGDTVSRGKVIVNISSNYQGGDAAGVQAQIASVQNKNVQETFQTQMDIIDRQADVATASASNAEQLQQISSQSVGETNDLISQNQDIINTLDTNITDLTNSNTNGGNDALILQAKEMRTQFQAAVNQLSEAVRQTQYQTDTTKPPTLLTALQQEITLKQLDVQRKSLELNKEVSGLQASLAAITASMMHPTSPVPGTVERVYVNQYQSVTPGTMIALIQASDPDVTAVVSVPREVSKTVSQIQPSTLHIGDQEYSTLPRFISTEATEGTSYSVMYSIPTDLQPDVTNNGYVTVDIPLGNIDTGKTVPFIPIDSVYQSEDSSYVYVVKKGKAEYRTVTLGNVYGRYVEVTNGLTDGDQVIVDRNVIAGDTVKE